jgi:hypothetical protein
VVTASAATRIINAAALANISSTLGDRIVVEIGVSISSAGGNRVTVERFGDTAATADFALTSGLTTDLIPWAEFSATIPVVGLNSYNSEENIRMSRLAFDADRLIPPRQGQLFPQGAPLFGV